MVAHRVEAKINFSFPHSSCLTEMDFTRLDAGMMKRIEERERKSRIFVIKIGLPLDRRLFCRLWKLNRNESDVSMACLVFCLSISTSIRNLYQNFFIEMGAAEREKKRLFYAVVFWIFNEICSSIVSERRRK